MHRAMVLEEQPRIDSHLAYDVNCLVCAEAYGSNFQDMSVHLRTVHALVKLVGGSQKIDPGIMETIFVGEMYMAAATGSADVVLGLGSWNKLSAWKMSKSMMG